MDIIPAQHLKPVNIDIFLDVYLVTVKIVDYSKILDLYVFNKRIWSYDHFSHT